MAHAPLPPGPKGHPLWGNLSDFRRDRLGFLTRAARDWGDVVPLRFGPRRLLLVSDPALIESVLVANSRHFVKGAGLRRNRHVFGNGLLVSDGDFWRRQRRLAQPAFHRQRIAAYADTMVAYTERLLAGWRDGETRDLHQEMMGLTLEIVAKTLFDADVTGDVRAVGDALDLLMTSFTARMNLTLLLPESLPTPTNRRLREAVARLDAIVFGIIERRRAGGEDHGDLLSMLLQARDEDGGRMTDRQLRDEALTLFAAGHETTALALTWTFYLLAQHPAAEAKLAAELDAVLGGRAPTLEDRPNLPYTEQVVTEAMRLYPPAWTIGREAVADCPLGPYQLPKGDAVLMSQWVVHRDPRWFDRPDEFDPDRWADGLAKRLPRFAYFPFGGGPRVCIGNTFAQMEATLLLATIARRYRLALVPGRPIVPAPSITLRPKHGLRVTLHERAPRSADRLARTAS